MRLESEKTHSLFYTAATSATVISLPSPSISVSPILLFHSVFLR